MHILGILISVIIISAMLAYLGLVIYQKIQQIRGKDKKTLKELEIKEKQLKKQQKGGD